MVLIFNHGCIRNCIGMRIQPLRLEARIILRTNLFHLLLHLLHSDWLLFVLTALVLEPHPNDPRGEWGHLDQLFLHERIRAWVRIVTSPQSVQLFLIQYSAHARRFVLLMDLPPLLPSVFWRCDLFCMAWKDGKISGQNSWGLCYLSIVSFRFVLKCITQMRHFFSETL